MNTPLEILLKAGDGLGKRLRMIQESQIQARERGDQEVPVDLLWEPEDAAAPVKWEEAKASAKGQGAPLFPEALASPSRTVQVDLLQDFGDLTRMDQETRFFHKLRVFERRLGAPLDDRPWLDAWDRNRERAMEALLYALVYRRPVTPDVPTAMEVAAWKGGLK